MTGTAAARPVRTKPAAAARRDAFAPITVMMVVLVLAMVAGGVSFVVLDAPAARYAADHLSAFRGPARLLTALGLSGYMLVGSAAVAASAFLALRNERDRGVRLGLRALRDRAVFVFAAVAVSGVVSQICKHLLGRARPKLIDTLGPAHFDLFSIKASLASLPSGHTTSAFALATALTLMVPVLGWPLFVMAALIGMSRYMVGAHYLSDVIAGAALGAIVALWLAVLFADRAMAFARVGRGLRLADAGTVWPALRTLARRRSVS